MTLSPCLFRFWPAACLLGCLVLAYPGGETPDGKAPTTLETPITETARANELIRRQPGVFVPNLGQWDHPVRFVHRSGPMTLFLEGRGWVIDLVEHPVEQRAKPHEPGSSAAHRAMPGEGPGDGPDDGTVEQKINGVALRMTFEGDAHVPEIVGEEKLPGHHNYLLGNDESRWRSGVPLYGSVRYENLYPGIDLRLRQANGVPEYDLLLQPGSDLSRVAVHVEGEQNLSIASDSSLVIETALGPVTQSVPKTWQVDANGRRCELACSFTLLGADRFGFAAPGWDGDTSLTIDPGLIWSTFLGGSGSDLARALSVDQSGVVTVAGRTSSTKFPTSSGAYDTSYNGGFEGDTFVSRLDPSKTGTAQLVYSTFLGGNGFDRTRALSVDQSGVVTVAGETSSTNFPTSSGAYDTTHNDPIYGADAFVSRLDPSKTGSAQLVYSTYLGGSHNDLALALFVDQSGVVTVGGVALSTNFPTSSGAYHTTHNGRADAFVSRLDPSKTGAAQLVYSTFLGGSGVDVANALSVDQSGVVTVAGLTRSTNFPATSGAYDTTYNGSIIHPGDAFVSRLDPSKTGTAQLVYSTFLGGSLWDNASGLSVDQSGVVTVAGQTASGGFPTTSGAYDTTFNGRGPFAGDAFVSRLDPSKTGTAQLVYSTFLGGSGEDRADALSVDQSGVVTVAGETWSVFFPTTSGAYDRTYSGSRDAFVSRLDPSKTGTAQLAYSTFLGGKWLESASALCVDASGLVTVAGNTQSTDFPTTSGVYDTSYNGGFEGDAFVSRLSMGVTLRADRFELSLKQGGTQTLTLNAGKQHANKIYFLLGSLSGTKPGIGLGNNVTLPLNLDAYFTLTLVAPNSPLLTNALGKLDSSGSATAKWNVIPGLPRPPVQGFLLHHAYVVFGNSPFDFASNAVPLTLLR